MEAQEKRKVKRNREWGEEEESEETRGEWERNQKQKEREGLPSPPSISSIFASSCPTITSPCHCLPSTILSLCPARIHLPHLHSCLPYLRIRHLPHISSTHLSRLRPCHPAIPARLQLRLTFIFPPYRHPCIATPPITFPFPLPSLASPFPCRFCALPLSSSCPSPAISSFLASSQSLSLRCHLPCHHAINTSSLAFSSSSLASPPPSRHHFLALAPSSAPPAVAIALPSNQ